MKKLFACLSFLGGFVVTGIILAFIYLLILFVSFDLPHGETLLELEVHRTTVLIITLGLVLFAGHVARGFISGNKRFVAYGVRVMALLCFIVVAGNYIYNLTIPTDFNKTKWEQSDFKPYHMAATLVKRDTLIGFTKEEVQEMLGPGAYANHDINTGNGSVRYHVEDTWTLTIIFENDKVVATRFRLPYLCV